MDRYSPPPRLLYLLSRLTDGLLDPAEAKELNALLLADPDARAYHRCHSAVHLGLGNLAEVGGKVVTMPVLHNRPRWRGIAAAAAVFLAAGTIWWLHRPLSPATHTVGPANDRPRPILAVAFATVDLDWDLDKPPVSGEQLGPGSVRVAHGEVSLSLVNGQLIHIKGPGEIELINQSEISIRQGNIALRTIGGRGPFIVHLPQGALVDTGSEYSLEVAADGTSEVQVFENTIVASTVGSSGDTLEELQLQPGASTVINNRITPGSRPASSFLRMPPVPATVLPGETRAYAAEVLRSSPLSYWRFEQTDHLGRVPDETGRHPLILMEQARISGSKNHRYLFTDTGEASGFAHPAEALPGLDSGNGFTVEGLLFSSSEGYSTALALEEVDAFPLDAKWEDLRHAPQTFAIERMGRKGEHIGHIHPDFALRSLFRSPAGYDGGTNLYSRQSHLLHRWFHVAAVCDNLSIRLYLDGELSATTSVSLPFHNARLRPIIGRLQPHPDDELRQWVGGIDEVALYGRALSAEEVRSHAAALKP